MISEKTFASTFNSFWQEATPTGEVFVRTMNLTKRHFNRPFKSNSEPKRRALINELGFLLFKTSVVKGYTLELLTQSVEAGANLIDTAINIIQRYQGAIEDEVKPPTETEMKEAFILAKRLTEFFNGIATKEEINFFA